MALASGAFLIAACKNKAELELELLQSQMDAISKIESIDQASSFIDTLIENYSEIGSSESIDIDAVLTNLYLRRFVLAEMQKEDGIKYFERALSAHMRRASKFENISDDVTVESEELRESIFQLHDATKDYYWLNYRDRFTSESIEKLKKLEPDVAHNSDRLLLWRCNVFCVSRFFWGSSIC